jgi:hypothetical protein
LTRILVIHFVLIGIHIFIRVYDRACYYTENEVFAAKNQLAEARIDDQIAQLRILTGTGDLLEALNIPLPDVGEEPRQAVADSGQ